MAEHIKGYTKDEFISFWPNGYYEQFGWGVGYKEVYRLMKGEYIGDCAEIGPGGGTFTELLINDFKTVKCVDVVPPSPLYLSKIGDRAEYIEAESDSVGTVLINNESVDFVFCYNVFCHLTHTLVEQYLIDIKRILKANGVASIMFPLWERAEDKKHIPNKEQYKYHPVDCWYYYSEDDIKEMAKKAGLNIKSIDLIPKHRDRIVVFENV